MQEPETITNFHDALMELAITGGGLILPAPKQECRDKLSCRIYPAAGPGIYRVFNVTKAAVYFAQVLRVEDDESGVRYFGRCDCKAYGVCKHLRRAVKCFVRGRKRQLAQSRQRDAAPAHAAMAA